MPTLKGKIIVPLGLTLSPILMKSNILLKSKPNFPKCKYLFKYRVKPLYSRTSASFKGKGRI
jgi:hypothetical protein